MLKFAALNDSSSEEDSEEEESETAKEESQYQEVYKLYDQALQLVKLEKRDEAKNSFCSLLECGFLKEVVDEEITENDEKAVKLRLKYSIYKNLANLCEQQLNHVGALEYLLQALVIDCSDVTLWYEIGKAALVQSEFLVAKMAFEEGLLRNPHFWPCTENLVNVLYGLGDYPACMHYVAKALEKDDTFLLGLALKQKVLDVDPLLGRDAQKIFQHCDVSVLSSYIETDKLAEILKDAEDLKTKRDIQRKKLREEQVLPVLHLRKPMESLSWKCLGQGLIDLHSDLSTKTLPNASFACEISLKNSKPHCDESLSNQPVSATANNEKLTDQLVDKSANEAGKKTDFEDLSELEHGDGYSTQDISEYEETGSPFPQTMANDQKKKGPKKRRVEKFPIFDFGDDFGKRRSARVKNVVKKSQEEGINYQKLLTSLLPKTLTEDQSALSGSGSYLPAKFNEFGGKSCENLANELEEVEAFLNEHLENYSIVGIMKDYLTALSAKWQFHWPEGLSDVYVEIYDRFHQHVSFPSLPFDESDAEEAPRETAWISLLAQELKTDQMITYWKTVPSTTSSENSSAEPVPAIEKPELGEFFRSDLLFLQCASGFDHLLYDKSSEFLTRFCWSAAWFHITEGRTKEALDYLDWAADTLKEMKLKNNNSAVMVQVPNCRNCSCIHEVLPNPLSFRHRCFCVDTLSSCVHELIGEVQRQLLELEVSHSLEHLQEYWETEKYQEVVDLLSRTFQEGKYKRTLNAKDEADRKRHLLMLQESLVKLKKFQQCVTYGQKSLHESLESYEQAEEGELRTAWASTIVELLTAIEEAIEKSGNALLLDTLDQDVRCRLAKDLVNVISLNMNLPEDNTEPISTVLPWLLLFKILVYEEKSNKASLIVSKEMRPSVRLLLVAHEHLGRKEWCSHSDSALLLCSVIILEEELAKFYPDDHPCKEELAIAMEQCFFCLYGHPSKKSKSKHLDDHGAKQIELTWERTFPLFKYFRPDPLPEFDSYKISSITHEVAMLFKQILTLIPSNIWNPAHHIDEVIAFIKGKSGNLPAPPDPSFYSGTPLKDIYYLLADFYFKNKEARKAMKYYMHDICINPRRLDSWAGAALSRSFLLEETLESADLAHDATVPNQASAALRCFEQALSIDPTNCALWIENGSIAYQLQHYISCQSQMSHWGSFAKESEESLHKRWETMLNRAETCYNAAAQCNFSEERWLPYYMLGKIAEKRKTQPSVFLGNYSQAAECLHESGATYPKKLPYYNPTYLAVESLEVYYRLHVSVLKYLHRQPDNVNYDLLQSYLTRVAEGPFANFKETVDVWKEAEWGDETSKRTSSSVESEKETVNEDDCTSLIVDAVDHVTDIVVITEDLLERVCCGKQLTKQSDSHSMRDICETSFPCQERNFVKSTHVNSCPAVLKEDQVKDFENSALVKQSSTDTAANINMSDENSPVPDCIVSLVEEMIVKVSADVIECTTDKSQKADINRCIHLIKQCISALQTCLSRFPHHYKSLYWLSHTYLHSPYVKNLQYSRDILLGPEPSLSWSQLDHMSSPGLFQDRKHSNFFNGIWRIPVNEINRGGCFASHMYRSVVLLLALLKEQKDYTMLYTISTQLNRVPDFGRKYLRDVDRVHLAKRSYNICLQVARERVKNMRMITAESGTALLTALYRIWVHGQKLSGAYISASSKILVNAYKKIKGGDEKDEKKILDKAVRFCIYAISRPAQENFEMGESKSSDAASSQSESSPTRLHYTTSTATPIISPSGSLGKGRLLQKSWETSANGKVNAETSKNKRADEEKEEAQQAVKDCLPLKKRRVENTETNESKSVDKCLSEQTLNKDPFGNLKTAIAQQAAEKTAENAEKSVNVNEKLNESSRSNVDSSHTYNILGSPEVVAESIKKVLLADSDNSTKPSQEKKKPDVIEHAFNTSTKVKNLRKASSLAQSIHHSYSQSNIGRSGDMLSEKNKPSLGVSLDEVSALTSMMSQEGLSKEELLQLQHHIDAKHREMCVAAAMRLATACKGKSSRTSSNVQQNAAPKQGGSAFPSISQGMKRPLDPNSGAEQISKKTAKISTELRRFKPFLPPSENVQSQSKPATASSSHEEVSQLHSAKERTYLAGSQYERIKLYKGNKVISTIPGRVNSNPTDKIKPHKVQKIVSTIPGRLSNSPTEQIKLYEGDKVITTVPLQKTRVLEIPDAQSSTSFGASAKALFKHGKSCLVSDRSRWQNSGKVIVPQDQLIRPQSLWEASKVTFVQPVKRAQGTPVNVFKPPKPKTSSPEVICLDASEEESTP